MTGIFVPELQRGYTNTCCSDQQVRNLVTLKSFFENGFPATFFFERMGPLVDYEYHSSLDLSSRAEYDVKQIELIAKSILATAAVKAEIIPKKEE